MTRKREFEFSLAAPIGVHKDGEKHFADKITLVAPSVKNNKSRCIIKQAIAHCIAESQKNRESNSDVVASSETNEDFATLGPIMATSLYVFLDSNQILEVINAFTDLLISGCGRVLDTPLTTFHLEQLDAEDLDKMLGEYIVNFFKF